jgi:hypothetical protein
MVLILELPSLHQYHVHPQHIGDGQVIALHPLLCQFAVEVTELIKAGCESVHHLAAWTLPLLTIDIVSQSIIKDRLKMAPLTFGNSSNS